MPKHVKSWGIEWNEEMYHALTFVCQCDKTEYHIRIIRDQLTNLVGFHDGIGVFLCPSCHEYFWFHMHQKFADLYAKNCPAWPKK